MKSIFNFRDLGGVSTPYGKIKPRVFIRGGSLNSVSEEDTMKLLNDYKLKTIIDFRDDREVSAKPDAKYAGVEHYHIDIIGNQHVTANPAVAAENMVEKEYMEVLYENFLHAERSSAGYKKFVDILKDHEEGSLYFHCSAGKDRTGFAGYILLKILGATDEVVMEDYLKSNNVSEEQLSKLLSELTVTNPEIDIEELKTWLGVKESYLKASIAAIEDLYGDFDTYREKALDISDIDVLEIRARFLE